MATLSGLDYHIMFISFRGNLRYGFVSNLTDALKRHNINFFIDTHEQNGRDLDHLFKRIEEATIALVILSTRYAESRWCLEELRTIMDKAEKGEIIVIPIFYKVKPGDVEKLKGVFGDKFWSHAIADESSREEIEKWQEALKAVSKKVGITLYRNTYQAKFIKKVVKEIKKVLTSNKSGEGRENHCVKKVKTFKVPLALLWPWSLSWFGSVVGLISAVLGLLSETVQFDEGREDDCVKKVKTFTVPLDLPWSSFGSAVRLIGAVLGLLTETVQSDEGREKDCVKKVKTFNVPLALPWSWFGSTVGLIGAVLALLTETVHKCASPAIVILAGQAVSVVAISSRWTDRSV